MAAHLLPFPLFLLFLALASAQPQKSNNTLDRESAIAMFTINRVFTKILAEDLETPIQFRANLFLDLAIWNAWSNYHPTAADIFGRTRFKRPEIEHTASNKNIAVLYSIFRVYQASPQSFGGPSRIPEFRGIFKENNLNPGDMSTNMSTPVGIGNREGLDTARLMAIDGWNDQGQLTATQQNYRQPFADYTNYIPKNTPWTLKFPFKWQPLLENNRLGFFFRQESVTPFAGTAIAFSQTPSQISRRRVSLPYTHPSASAKSAKPSDIRLLKKFARDVFHTSATLTEKQQIFAELFDNKVKAFVSGNRATPGIAVALRFFLLGPALDWDMEQDMVFGLSSGIGAFDSMVASWKEKRRLDAVRPTGQAMQFLFGDSKFSVFGGPGKRPVNIRAGEWQPYIRTMPHAEFPSGSACVCTTLVELALLATDGKEDFPFQTKIPKGSSKHYPGQVPSNDTVIRIEKLSDWKKICGQSRLWAGVHFKPSVLAGEKLCSGIGRDSMEFVQKLIKGELDPKWLSWLPKNSNKFWEENLRKAGEL